MEAVCEQWKYNEQRELRLPVKGVKVLITDEGIADVVIVIPEAE